MIDEFDTLRAAFLKSHGFFGEADRVLECRWTRHGGTVVLNWIGGVDCLFVECADRRHRIMVEQVDEGQGRRAYFICPISSQRCRDLFLVDEQLGCRTALRLRYRSETLTPLKRKVWKQAHGGALPPYVPNDPRVAEGQARCAVQPIGMSAVIKSLTLM